MEIKINEFVSVNVHLQEKQMSISDFVAVGEMVKKIQKYCCDSGEFTADNVQLNHTKTLIGAPKRRNQPRGFWTTENKMQFCKEVKEIGSVQAAEKYGLKVQSVETNYARWKGLSNGQGTTTTGSE